MIGDPRTILLVEDNPDHEMLTRRALRKGRIDNPVVATHDGQEALDYFFGPHGAAAGEEPWPAMVLLDLKLPRLDGLEVLRRLRGDARTRTLPVVVMTSSREDEDRATCYGAGANSYVRKPVDFDRFADAVRQVGQYWLSLNEPPPEPRA